jgi:hypothetical protein
MSLGVLTDLPAEIMNKVVRWIDFRGERQEFDPSTRTMGPSCTPGVCNVLTTLPEKLFSDLEKLASLWLSDVKLEVLPETIFNGLAALDDLWLSNNLLEVLPENIFNGLTSLTKLRLDNNNFKVLPKKLFSGLTALKMLSLRANVLTVLEATIFSGLTAMDDLDIAFNTLKVLPSNVFSGLFALETLALGGNLFPSDSAHPASFLAAAQLTDLLALATLYAEGTIHYNAETMDCFQKTDSNQLLPSFEHRSDCGGGNGFCLEDPFPFDGKSNGCGCKAGWAWSLHFVQALFPALGRDSMLSNSTPARLYANMRVVPKPLSLHPPPPPISSPPPPFLPFLTSCSLYSVATLKTGEDCEIAFLGAVVVWPPERNAQLISNSSSMYNQYAAATIISSTPTTRPFVLKIDAAAVTDKAFWEDACKDIPEDASYIEIEMGDTHDCFRPTTGTVIVLLRSVLLEDTISELMHCYWLN